MCLYTYYNRLEDNCIIKTSRSTTGSFKFVFFSFIIRIVGSIFFQDVEQSANIIVPVDNIIRYNDDELQSVFCFDVEYLLKMFMFYFFSPQQKLSVIQTIVVLFEVL